MLVLLSDLHLTDESTSNNVKGEVFSQVLKSEILRNAEENKAKEIRIVLLGDILDFVRSDYWLRKKIDMGKRPWGGNIDPETAMNSNINTVEKQFHDILNDILKTKPCRALFRMLNDIAEQSGIYTKVTYVIGNHDRILWNFESLQDKIRNRLKKVTLNNKELQRVEFLNVLYTPEYGVIARHGHEWDKICHGYEFYNKVLNKGNSIGRFDLKAYKVMALGEVIAAELMAGLIYNIRRSSVFNNEDVIMKELKDLNNIRPMIDVFRYLEWIIAEKKLSSEYKNIIYDSLKKAIESLLSSSFAKKWDDISIDTIITGDLVDRLQLLYSIMATTNYEKIKSAVMKLFSVVEIFKSNEDNYSKRAEEEWDWMNSNDARNIQYILYGHTHLAKHDYFRGYINGRVRMYINTGTYLPLIQRSKSGVGFVDSFQMTMAFFYRKDEDRAGRGRNPSEPTMELWNGIKRKKYLLRP